MIEQHSSLTEKFIKKGVWLYLFSFVMAPMGYIIKIIISGELSVSEVGILYGIISLITLLSAYNDLGMTDSLNYFVPKFITEKRYDKVKSILAYTFIAQMSTGISIALFFFFGADFIAGEYFEAPEAANTLKIFAFYFLGVNIFQIISTFFLVIQNTFLNKMVELVRISFILISTITIFNLNVGNLINFSYNWIVGLYLGIIFAIIIFYQKYYKRYLQKEKIIWDKGLFRQIFKYAITIFVGVQAGVILSQVDMQMIIYLLGTTQAGYYTNYLSIIGIPFMVITPIFGLLFPICSEMHSKGEIKKIKNLKTILSKNFTLIAIASNTLFFVFAEVIAFILFGEKFITSGKILQYSVLLLLFNFLLQINFNIMGGIGKVKERVKIIAIAVVFNIVTNLIFIHLIGVYGAALATGIGWILIWVLSETYLGKTYRIQINYRSIYTNIFFMFILGIGSYIYVVPLFNDITRWPSFFYMSLISILWFGIFILINRKEFKILIQEIQRIRKIKPHH